MRKIYLLIAALLFLAPVTYAAGGGGGGGSSGGGGSTQCTADIYTCSNWGPCTAQGTRARTCSFDYDCPFVTDPVPKEAETCEYVSKLLSSLKCQNLGTSRERVACRLGLSEKEQEYELQIQYLPEECRVISEVAERESCVKRYGSLRPCWTKPYSQRAGCVRSVLGMKDVKGEVEACDKKSAGEKPFCMKSLRGKVDQLTKARFYDLEERAEELMEQGANKDIITDFVTNVELKKQEFNKATAIDEKKQTVLEVREFWQKFISDVRKQ